MTDLSGLSASEAIEFLQWLDETGRHNLVALDPTGKEPPAAILTERLDVAQRFVQEWNGKRNLYFSINEPAVTARPDTKLRRDEIGAVRAFHVDIDRLEGADWDMDCLPSAVIDSGGGKWGFWKLASKIPADDVAAIEAQNRALTARFHGDAQAHNLDRIARLPGTLNIPNEAKRKKGRLEAIASTVTLGGPLWEPQEVAAWCPPAPVESAAHTERADQTPLAELDSPASVARATRYLLLDAGEAVEGSNGNAATYAVAARLKDFGISQSTAFELLLDCWNETKAIPPWDARDLKDITKNAYAYGTAPPGRNAANLAESEFAPVSGAATEAPKPTGKQLAGEDFADINEDFTAEPVYLIDGWYDQQTLVVTYGESNSGKTHVVLDQAMAIAAGRKWGGHITHQGLVVYVAAEGGRGVRRRVMAHRLFRPENAALPFSLVSYPINLMHAQADAKALVAYVKAAEARFGQKCVMVVVDTLSRALAGGDENSSADMGAFVKRCDEIRAATGAALHVIHHAGKNTAKGARGHSLLRAAVDSEIEIESNTILCRKQRDMEGARELRFDYKSVLLGRQAGREVTSVVLDVWEPSEFDDTMTPQTQKVLSVIDEIICQKHKNDGCSKTSNVTLKEVKNRGLPHATVDRAFAELVDLEVLAKSRHGLYKLKQNLKTS